MITLLLPIGKFSIFADLCIENIMSTCGDIKELDLVFLTSKTISHNLSERFRWKNEVIVPLFGYNVNKNRIANIGIKKIEFDQVHLQ